MTTDRLTGLLLYQRTEGRRGERGQRCKTETYKVPTGTAMGSAHQRRRERQASHRGFQLVHRGGDALGAVRDQRLDSNSELFPAVLVLLGVAGGGKLLPSGSW